MLTDCLELLFMAPDKGKTPKVHLRGFLLAHILEIFIDIIEGTICHMTF